MRAVMGNLGPSSTSFKEAVGDITAVLDTEPNLFGGCEAVGKGALPRDEHYTKIRERSNEFPGRSNIFSYTRGKMPKAYRWTDMDETFDKMPGRRGQHVPRSFLSYQYGGAQYIWAHHPPNWPGTAEARAEHLRALQKRFAPWTDEERWARFSDKRKQLERDRPRVLFWDRNMTLLMARKFATSMDAWVVGEKIDCAIVRNIKVGSAGYQKKFEGHTVHTDHPWGYFWMEYFLK